MANILNWCTEVDNSPWCDFDLRIALDQHSAIPIKMKISIELVILMCFNSITYAKSLKQPLKKSI